MAKMNLNLAGGGGLGAEAPVLQDGLALATGPWLEGGMPCLQQGSAGLPPQGRWAHFQREGLSAAAPWRPPPSPHLGLPVRWEGARAEGSGRQVPPRPEFQFCLASPMLGAPGQLPWLL